MRRTIKKISGFLTALGLMLSLCGCQSTGNGEGTAEDNGEIVLGRTTFSFDQELAPFDYFVDYRITPGDVLDVLYHVKTWHGAKEFVIAIDHVISVKFVHLPNLNETERVRPDGNITLPLLGEFRVVGMTVAQLTEELKKHYSAHLQDPELYVMVPEFHSAIKELKADLHTAPRGLSRLTTVRPDGHATFAMLGDVFVVGKTIPQIGHELNRMYQEILPGLQVDLFLEESRGGRIYVMGEVTAPNAYQVIKPTTVIEALAMAGSTLPSAKLDSIVVVRKHEGKMVGKKLDLRKTLTLTEGSEFFYLQPDDIVYVPRRHLARWADVTRDLADIAFFRGWGASMSYEINKN